MKSIIDDRDVSYQDGWFRRYIDEIVSRKNYIRRYNTRVIKRDDRKRAIFYGLKHNLSAAGERACKSGRRNFVHGARS